MRVNVVDPLGRDPRGAERVQHCAATALALRRHAGHVERIPAHAVADDFGEDCGAARLGKAKLLQDQDARTLANDKAVPVAVPGTAGVHRIVIAGGKRLHRRKAAHGKRCDRTFGTARDHRIRVAALDGAEGIADCVRGAGAGGRSRLVGTFRAPADTDVAGSQIDDRRRDEEGRDTPRAAVHQGRVLALDDIEAADAGADMYADVVGVFGSDPQGGVLHGLLSSGHGEVNEAAHLAGLFDRNELVRIEVLNLGGDPDGVAFEGEGGDLGHATPAGHQTLPDLRCGVAHTADQTKACDDDATLLHLPWLPFRCLAGSGYFFWCCSM